MTGPDFRWGEAERIHVDHGDGRRHLFLGHLLHIKVRTHFARLFVANKLSQLEFLLLVNVAFLVLGCFLDTAVLLLVFIPVLLMGGMVQSTMNAEMAALDQMKDLLER